MKFEIPNGPRTHIDDFGLAVYDSHSEIVGLVTEARDNLYPLLERCNDQVEPTPQEKAALVALGQAETLLREANLRLRGEDIPDSFARVHDSAEEAKKRLLGDDYEGAE